MKAWLYLCKKNKQNVHRQLQPLDVASLSLSLRSSLEQSKGEEGIALGRESFNIFVCFRVRAGHQRKMSIRRVGSNGERNGVQ